MNIINLGWNDFFAASFQPFKESGCFAGKVSVEHKQYIEVYCEFGEINCEISGKFRHQAKSQEEFPAVGDWIAFRYMEKERKGIVQQILPRTSKISRKVAGQNTQEQVIAANVDYLFIVTSLNTDFNMRRLERYLTVAWDSGSSPVIILNKADLCTDTDSFLAETEEIAFGVPVHLMSALNKEGLEQLQPYFEGHKTCALIGSSGVGKSTIINKIIGTDRQRVNELRPSMDKGMHTTTQRELIILPDGGLLIDTPGMREIQLWDADQGVAEAFEDVTEYAKNCRFRNCQHRQEPGCAVRNAVENGDIGSGRFQNFQKMQEELQQLKGKQELHARLEAKRQDKILHRAIKNMKKVKGK
ncbi:MAG: ribosome small subunit-dependent GTPase A [Calditrichaeota bacterium]|nr:MAG: ribosome small subunit-dependent GTPase A [Calditrichota bacterium]